MRWILSGAHAAASRALCFLVERGDEVLAVGHARDDGRDGWQPSFRATAQRLGVPFEQPRRINARDSIEKLAAFGARAFVSIQYDQILRAPFFAGIGCPCLNLHFSLLPRHRGVQPIAWAVLSGDREAGVTLHHMAVEIDAGDVIAQKRVPVAADETARELYDASADAAFELFRESYPFADALLATRLEQDPAEAVYHSTGELDFGDRTADWTRPAAALQPWLRALIFPPFQYPETRWRGGTVRIERVAGPPYADAAGVAPGSVVSKDQRGVRVACGGGSLLITAVARSGEASARTDSVLSEIEVGERLGCD